VKPLHQLLGTLPCMHSDNGCSGPRDIADRREGSFHEWPTTKIVYIEAPEDYDFGGKVLRLKKVLKGLKQAHLLQIPRWSGPYIATALY
jgi:hypothetical protein